MLASARKIDRPFAYGNPGQSWVLCLEPLPLSSWVHVAINAMRTWGQVLVAFMALGLFGCLIDDDPQGDLEALPGLAMFGGVGAYLWIDGQKRLDKLQACSEAALKSNRQLGHIDCMNLSASLQIPETEVRAKIAKAQKKGWVPYGIEMK